MSSLFFKPVKLPTDQSAIDAIRRAHHQGREHYLHGSKGSAHIGDFVFGGIDGAVTTFAIVAGVAGAQFSLAVVMVLGLANLLADGFAMAVGNFLSIRSDHERYAKERAAEEWEVEHIPEEERNEIAHIYMAKGFSGDTLEQIVNTITADKKRWVDTMMQEELGLSHDTRSAAKGGIITFLSFIVIGSIPLMSFVLAYFIDALQAYTLLLSTILTAIALFIIGALKTFVIDRPFWRSGLETLVLGGLAATMAYLVGYLLRGVT